MSRQLNEKQINTLKTILKFRYVTTDNLANHRGITHNSAYSALEILHTEGYLGKLHEKSYRLQNKSARYFLTAKGLHYLRYDAKVKLHETTWNSRRREESKTADFIDQQVAIHSAYVQLRERFGQKAKVLTAIDLVGIEGIIKPYPVLYVVPASGKHFFVELADGQHLFFVRKRIRKYIANYDADDWEWEKYPDVYIIRESASDRTRLKRFIDELMDDSYLDEDDFTFHIVGKVDQIKV